MIEADLTSRDFGKIAGGDFNFVSCHGVLSYIPHPDRVLRNLAECLARGGVVYLGVNGGTHFSEIWRRVLPEFNIHIDSFKDSRKVRAVLKVCDALSGNEIGWAANQTADYLASDLFGWAISNHPLNDWTKLGEDSGLHFLGDYSAHRTLRPLLTNDLYEVVYPRSRPEMHKLAEQLSPSTFHRLVLCAAESDVTPPWQKPREFLRWRISRSSICDGSWPDRRCPLAAYQDITITNRPTNTVIDLRAPGWLVDLVKHSRSDRKLGELVREISPPASLNSICKHLYLLHLLVLINVHPPETA